MATVITHAFVGAGMAGLLGPRPLPRRVSLACALLAVLPDADFLGWYFFRVPYGDPLGHRGATHSLFFALAAGFLAARILVRKEPGKPWSRGWRLPLLLALACASHGALDAMTNGGYGVAFFWPFSAERFFLPWRPIEVAPLAPADFFSRWTWLVLENEFLWVLIPLGVLLILGAVLRRFRFRRAPRAR